MAMAELIQEVTTLARVPTKNLKIDPRYQRQADQRRIERMATQWDDALAGVLEVSLRDGHLFVMDGQHRLLAARLHGVRMLRVLIHSDLDTKAEAERFAKLNTGRVRPNRLALFRARLVAEEPLALRIMACIRSHGLLLVDGSRDVGIRSIGVVEAIGGYDISLLDTTFNVIHAAWEDEEGSLAGEILGGVASFIDIYGRHPRYSERQLITKLARISTASLRRRIRELGDNKSAIAATDKAKGFNRLGPRQAVYEAYNWKLQNPLPIAGQSDMKRISLGQNPWAEEA